MNRELSPLHDESLEITLTVPLTNKKGCKLNYLKLILQTQDTGLSTEDETSETT